MTNRPEQGTNPIPQFAGNLLRYRDAAGLSQDALARQIDVTVGSVKLWEAGRVIPRARQLAGLSLALGVPVAAFFAVAEDEDRGQAEAVAS